MGKQLLGENFSAESLCDLDWGIFLSKYDVGDDFIEKYSAILDWDKIFSYKLPKNFIEKYKQHLNVERVFDIFSRDNFIKRYKSYLNWQEISSSVCITEAFVDKYNAYIVFEVLPWYRFSQKFIEKYKNRVNWNGLNYCKDLPLEQFCDLYKDYVNWDEICNDGDLSSDFLEKHLEYISWYYLPINCLGEEFIEKYEAKLNWGVLSPNHEITIELIKRYSKRWDYQSILQFVSDKEMINFIKTLSI